MIDVEEWAEIRRLHRAEAMGVKAIALRAVGVARNTVRSALRSDVAPHCVGRSRCHHLPITYGPDSTVQTLGSVKSGGSNRPGGDPAAFNLLAELLTPAPTDLPALARFSGAVRVDRSSGQAIMCILGVPGKAQRHPVSEPEAS